MAAQQYAIPKEPWKTRFKRLPRPTQLTLIFTTLNMIGIAIYFAMLYVFSEKWWFSSVLVYAPRSPFAVPSVVLLIAGLMYHRKSALANLFGIVITAGLMMGLQIPLKNMMSKPPAGNELKIVSCNVQGFQPNFGTVLQEVSALNPDIVAFQEIPPQNQELLHKYFENWQHVLFDEYFVASKYPIRMLGTCESESYERFSAIAVEIQTPDGPVNLCNVHLMTPRGWLEEVNPKGVLTGESQGIADNHYTFREMESAITRGFVAGLNPEIPLLITGDFNAPADSNLFHSLWGDYQNAFAAAGFGYGYTAPCAKHRLWLSEVPWIRIDHILTNDSWYVKHCETGKKNGSDHRLVTATVIRK